MLATARLAPGGRGLFDVRLPRAMPTWNSFGWTRATWLFLKDHKVEKPCHFPRPRHFLRWRLKPVVQLFEGQPFVVEDFRNPQAAHPAGSAIGRAARILLFA